MKVVVAGAGYVGLSSAVSMAQTYNVVLIDIDSEKIKKLKRLESPISDKELSSLLMKGNLNLVPTDDEMSAYENADIVFVATPTNYDERLGNLDTSQVEYVVNMANKVAQNAIIVIRSTLPIGFTEFLSDKYNNLRFVFCPEFLREGRALYDTMHPFRVIIGIPPKTEDKEAISDFVKSFLVQEEVENSVPYLITGSSEAEAIKLFANTYLAMRVGFFNELDMFAESNNLSAKDIITGVGLDKRIGDYYNNPSFGYGGYCLPKDSKQLLKAFKDLPQSLISATVETNVKRKEYIVHQILSQGYRTVGIYRVNMKCNSDNYRESSILDIAKGLYQAGVKVIVYEPSLSLPQNQEYSIINSFDELKKQSEVIISNRMDKNLAESGLKVYTRDIYCRD